ncbi:uncharacterized protein BDZ99DRAFT_470889 [Mytilinidion resinicola]|uniref:RING-type domain-containing protein n=1 Tax=Mytilinidion resinicola TaxID=574789 RepID=A0A6A6ZCM8_9PEZI|nr:uncharacterized protein BDZ99DRAFT_470889 [Mytilinidion resinicola]KAF2817957.1 hypothetical protein BDZ99DRAFT_470889 [Mytilinidion resinicola]
MNTLAPVHLQECSVCYLERADRVFLQASCRHNAICVECFRDWINYSQHKDCPTCRMKWSTGEVVAASLTGAMLRTRAQYRTYVNFDDLPRAVKVDISAAVKLPSVFQVEGVDMDRREFSINLSHLLNQVREFDEEGSWIIPAEQRNLFFEPMYRQNVFSFPTPFTAASLRQLNNRSYDWIEEIAVTSFVSEGVEDAAAFHILCNILSERKPASLRRVRITAGCITEYLLKHYDCDEGDFFETFPDLVEKIVPCAVRLIMAIKNNGWDIEIELETNLVMVKWFCHHHGDDGCNLSHEWSTQTTRNYMQLWFRHRYEEVERLLEGYDIDVLGLDAIQHIIGYKSADEDVVGEVTVSATSRLGKTIWQQRLESTFI